MQHPFNIELSVKYYSVLGGNKWEFHFPNGYGASVICHMGSYGYPDKWELAVLDKAENGEFNLTYSTEITDDVIGYLSEAEVSDLLHKICRLERI